MSEPQHQPARPEWTCEDCAEEWPCELARSRLRSETGGGVALAMLMVAYLEDFVRDVPSRATGEFDRFVNWTRSIMKPDPDDHLAGIADPRDRLLSEFFPGHRARVRAHLGLGGELSADSHQYAQLHQAAEREHRRDAR